MFVAYGGGHIAMVLPVIQELRLLAVEVDCVLLALTTGYARAQKAGERQTSMQVLGYKDFLHLVDEQEALQWGEKLLGRNNSPDVSREESLAYLGINYLDLIAQHGLDGAAQVYAEKGRYGFMPLHFMRQVMDTIQPDVVVATNSPRSEEAALAVAVERRIPSVGMVDLFGLDSDPYVARDIKPDWTCVIAESVRQRLVKCGFAPGGVVVTGNPAFDGLLTPSNLSAVKVFIAQRGWQGLKVLLWTGNIEPYTHPATDVAAGHALSLEVEAVLRELVHKNSDWALVVRYHPSEWHTYPPHQRQERVHFSIPSHEPIQPLILAASAVVVQNSTVGLESAVAGKPVVSIENSPSVHATFSLAAMQVSVPSATPSDLREVLPRVLAAKPVSTHPYRSDGLAALRAVRVIQQAVRQSLRSAGAPRN
jgi:UDP-N-acetylglucosamine 2-epimerase